MTLTVFRLNLYLSTNSAKLTKKVEKIVKLRPPFCSASTVSICQIDLETKRVKKLDYRTFIVKIYRRFNLIRFSGLLENMKIARKFEFKIGKISIENQRGKKDWKVLIEISKLVPSVKAFRLFATNFKLLFDLSSQLRARTFFAIIKNFQKNFWKKSENE